MTRCNHCGTANNNTFVCKTCGYSLINEKASRVRSSLGHSSRFMSFVKITLERVVRISPEYATALQAPIIDWEAIVHEEGQIVVKDRRYRELPPKSQLALFHFEMILLLLISLTVAFSSSFFISIDSLLRVYVISWLLTSFFFLFLFPLVVATTPIALLFEDAWIMNKDKQLFSFDILTLFLLWAGSILYAVPFLLYSIEWIVYRLSKRTTVSLLQSLLQITYMRRCD